MSGGLVGGVIGATLAFMTGMPPQVGWAIGSMIGSTLDQPQTKGPRLSDLTPQTSEYGKFIPIILGTGSVQGNVIWCPKFVETESSGSGKGGGGTGQTTYSYTGSFAVLVCEGPKQIGRIWAGPNKTILWDGNKLYGTGDIRVYHGTEDQLPDPAMEADKGVGHVPAYRGWCYVVFENLQLGPFGNALPQLTIEAGQFTAGSVSSSTTTYTGNQLTYSPLRTAYGTTTSTTTTTGTTVPFSIGFNVHEGGGSTSANTTVASIAQLRKFKNVRMDYFWDRDQTLPRDQITKLAAIGCTVQVSLQISYQWDYTIYSDLAAVEANAYSQTYTAVNAMKDLVHDYELLNEIQLRPDVGGQVAWNSQGTSTAGYVGQTAMESIAAVCKGMARAIHDLAASSGLPLRVILGVVGRDFGFLSYMASRGVLWDVTGFHVYPSFGTTSLLTDTWYGTGGPLVQLAAFGKPVTINEFNAGEIYEPSYENTAGGTVTEAGFSSLSKHLGELYVQNLCTLESVVLYELLDEPGKSAPEAIFGLMYTLASPKVALYIGTAYAGGTLTPSEQSEITTRGLLTDAQILALTTGTTTTTTTTTPPLFTGMYPSVFVPSTGRIWQANMEAGNGSGTANNWVNVPAGSISIIQPDTMTVVGTTTGDTPRSWSSLYYSAVTDSVWAIEGYGNHIARFNGTTGALIAEFALPDETYYVYAPQGETGTGALMIGGTRPFLGTVGAVDPTSGNFWLGSVNGIVYRTSPTVPSSFTSVDLNTTIGLGAWVKDIAVDAAGDAIYTDGLLLLTGKITSAMVPSVEVIGYYWNGVTFNPATALMYLHSTQNVTTMYNYVQAFNPVTEVLGVQSAQDNGTFKDIQYDAANNILWEYCGNAVRLRDPTSMNVASSVIVSGTPTTMMVGVPATTPCAFMSLPNSDLSKVCLTLSGTNTVPAPPIIGITLAAALTEVSRRVDLFAAQLDVTAMTDLLDGVIIASQNPARGIIESLRPAYYFDGVESGGKVKFVKRGGAIAAHITSEDLGAKSEGEVEDLLQITRQMEVELPRKVTVGYLLRANNYDHATKERKRLVGASGIETTLELPMVLLDAKAQEIADVNMYTTWAGRTTFAFRLPPSFSLLEPTDRVQIAEYSMRLTKVVDEKNYLSCEAQYDDITGYTGNAVVTETPIVPATVTNAPTLTFLEIL